MHDGLPLEFRASGLGSRGFELTRLIGVHGSVSFGL